MGDNNIVYISDSSTESETECSEILIGPKKKDEYISGACIICKKNYIQVLFHPCNHASICVDCFRALQEPKKCPYCGAIMTTVEGLIL